MSVFYPLKVQKITRETSEAVSVILEVPQEHRHVFTFISGQYLTFKKNIQGQEIRRSYSISSAPHEGMIQVGVKKINGGLFSTYIHDELNEGDVLEAMSPQGNFCVTLDAPRAKNYVFFASGSGITPVISMIKSILNIEKQSSISLFYGNKTKASIMFKKELDLLQEVNGIRLKVYHILSQESGEESLLQGRITESLCTQWPNNWLNTKLVDDFFICGPFEMLTNIQEYLKKQGVDKHKIHFELFTAPENQVVANDSKIETLTSSNVQVTLDGDTVSFTMPMAGKHTVLDYAQQQGMDLPFSCKGGVCCTCKAKVIQGKMEMVANYSLDEDEVEAGYVLTCQAKPRTAEVQISFDV